VNWRPTPLLIREKWCFGVVAPSSHARAAHHGLSAARMHTARCNHRLCRRFMRTVQPKKATLRGSCQERPFGYPRSGVRLADQLEQVLPLLPGARIGDRLHLKRSARRPDSLSQRHLNWRKSRTAVDRVERWRKRNKATTAHSISTAGACHTPRETGGPTEPGTSTPQTAGVGVLVGVRVGV
jgi:hypothetical protein